MTTERTYKWLFWFGIAFACIGLIYGVFGAAEQMKWAVILGISLVGLSMVDHFDKIKFGKDGAELIRKLEETQKEAYAKLEELNKLEKDIYFSIGKGFYDTALNIQSKQSLEDYSFWFIRSMDFLIKADSKEGYELMSNLIKVMDNNVGNNFASTTNITLRDVFLKDIKNLKKELSNRASEAKDISKQLDGYIKKLENLNFGS